MPSDPGLDLPLIFYHTKDVWYDEPIGPGPGTTNVPQPQRADRLMHSYGSKRGVAVEPESQLRALYRNADLEPFGDPHIRRSKPEDAALNDFTALFKWPANPGIALTILPINRRIHQCPNLDKTHMFPSQ